MNDHINKNRTRIALTVGPGMQQVSFSSQNYGFPNAIKPPI